jgi:hypothetical protein
MLLRHFSALLPPLLVVLAHRQRPWRPLRAARMRQRQRPWRLPPGAALRQRRVRNASHRHPQLPLPAPLPYRRPALMSLWLLMLFTSPSAMLTWRPRCARWRRLTPSCFWPSSAEVGARCSWPCYALCHAGSSPTLPCCLLLPQPQHDHRSQSSLYPRSACLPATLPLPLQACRRTAFWGC